MKVEFPALLRILEHLSLDTDPWRLGPIAARYGSRLRAGNCGSQDVRFAKPHGSTSWTLNLKAVPREVTWSAPEGGPIVDSLPAAHVDQEREPLVPGAVPIKSELIREVQELFCSREVFLAVAFQWRICVEAIRDADTLVVVGYSFPGEDQYGRFLVQEGLRLPGRGLRHGEGRPLRVEFFELEERAPERARVIFDVFGQWIRELVYRGPVLPRDGP